MGVGRGALERQRNTNLDGGLSGESRRWFESRVVNLDGGLSVVGLASVCVLGGGGVPAQGGLVRGAAIQVGPRARDPGGRGGGPGRGAQSRNARWLPRGECIANIASQATGGRGEVRAVAPGHAGAIWGHRLGLRSTGRASTADLGRAGRNRALPGSARFCARYSIEQGAGLYTGWEGAG